MSKSHDAGHTFSHSDLVAKVLGAWKKASIVDGVQGERKVNAGRTVQRMGSQQASGFTYPGVGGRIIPRDEDGAQHQEDHREAPFNTASKTKKS